VKTLLHPGNSQAWTRFPFLALLMRCVVGVYVMGRGMSAMLFVRRIISVDGFYFFIFEVGESGGSRRWKGRIVFISGSDGGLILIYSKENW
jgi:uncharacterized RDD family membrane protein YckC